MIDLDAIKTKNAERKAIRDAATPGPWEEHYKSTYGQVITGAEGTPILSGKTGYVVHVSDEDIALILLARSDNAAETIDALVVEVERLRQALDSVHTDVKCMLIDDPESRAMQNHAIFVAEVALRKENLL